MGVDIKPIKDINITMFGTYMDIKDPTGTGHKNKDPHQNTEFRLPVYYTALQNTILLHRV